MARWCRSTGTSRASSRPSLKLSKLKLQHSRSGIEVSRSGQLHRQIAMLAARCATAAELLAFGKLPLRYCISLLSRLCDVRGVQGPRRPSWWTDGKKKWVQGAPNSKKSKGIGRGFNKGDDGKFVAKTTSVPLPVCREDINNECVRDFLGSPARRPADERLPLDPLPQQQPMEVATATPASPENDGRPGRVYGWLQCEIAEGRREAPTMQGQFAPWQFATAFGSATGGH
jgi:hypothetical protein